MKTKYSLLLLVSIMIAVAAHGQFRVGIQGGMNSSKMKTNDEFSTSKYRITYPNYASLGYHVGLISQIQLFNFFIQPELLFSVTRNDINIYNLSSSSEAEVIEQKRNCIDIPVLFGMKMNVLKFEVGPVVTILISDVSDLEKITSYNMQLNRATIGFQVGAGLDVGRLAVDLKYEGNLSRIGDGISVGDNEVPFVSKMRQFIVSVGLFF